MTAHQQPDTTGADYSEPAFLPQDVDPQTHNPARCNLDVAQCPECAALERD